MCCQLIPVLPESLGSSRGSQGVANQLSLWLLSQVKELEEGAVCFEELKAQELPAGSAVGYGDQGTGKTVAK